MIKISSKQTGSTHVVIIIILVLVLIGALGFVFWRNFMQTPKNDKAVQVHQNNSSEKPPVACSGYDGAVEKDKVFCSKDVGIELTVPEVFAGKFQKKENYDVFEGTMEDSKGKLAGKSLYNYEAVVSSGDETLSLSIAKEPLRSGYSSISHALQRTYFNESSDSLTLVKSPTRQYNSETGTYTTTGSWSAGDPVPSFIVDSNRIYHGKVGDAGTVEDGYLMAIKDGIIVIRIKDVANPMKESTLEIGKVFSELDAYLKQLKFLD